MSTRSLLYWIALIGGGELFVQGYLNDRAALFHLGAWLLVAALAVTAARTRGNRVVAAAVSGAALVPAVLSALAFARVPAEPDPSPDDPAFFWSEHAADRRTLIQGDPEAGKRGFLELFGQQIAVDARGFRSRSEDDPQGEPRFRIVVFGDSTTFGATRSPDDLPWPALLEDEIERSLRCEVPVEVINAGTLGRGYPGIVLRFDEDVAALRADLVVYYPGPRDLGAVSLPLRSVPDAKPVPPRASSALRRIESAWRARRALRAFETARARTLPDDLDLRDTELARAYRRMILDARERGIDVVLTTIALALTPGSDAAEFARYEAIEPGTRRLVLAKPRHTLLARQVSASLRARIADVARDLDGGGDALFIDLWHLDRAGSERLAHALLGELAPMLSATPAPGCRPRA